MYCNTSMGTLFQNKRLVTMVGAMLALLLAALDQTIVATAMPEIIRELNGLSHLSWVFTAYMLASTVTVPIYGKLSDIYGRRIFYIIGIVLFLAGSMLSGIAGSMFQLILFRALQGLGAGAIMVNSFAVIGDLFPPAERGKWQGLFGAVFGLSSVVGPLLGGWITDSLTWRWVFYINLPLGLLALAFIVLTMPKSGHGKKGMPIDFTGAGVLAVSLVSLLLGLVWGGSEYAWNSTIIQALLTVGIAGLGLFAVVEHYAKDPLVPLRFFKNRAFSLSAFITFVTGVGMFGAILYLPLFAQGVIGFSATYAGLAITPMMAGLIISSTISGQIISRTGKYKWLIVGGIGTMSVAMFLFSQMSADTSVTQLIFNMVLMGLGLGVSMPTFNLIVQSAFGQESIGVVTASIQLFRSVGGTVGTAILGSVLNAGLAARLTNIGSEPFAQMAAQGGSALPTINSNSLQAFLTTQGKAQIQAGFANVPPSQLEQVQSAFNHFVHTIQVAFSGALAHAFFVSFWIVLLGFVAVLFMPELPLRKSNRPALEEIGVMLDEELGQEDPAREPRA